MISLIQTRKARGACLAWENKSPALVTKSPALKNGQEEVRRKMHKEGKEGSNENSPWIHPSNPGCSAKSQNDQQQAWLEGLLVPNRGWFGQHPWMGVAVAPVWTTVVGLSIAVVAACHGWKQSEEKQVLVSSVAVLCSRILNYAAISNFELQYDD